MAMAMERTEGLSGDWTVRGKHRLTWHCGMEWSGTGRDSQGWTFGCGQFQPARTWTNNGRFCRGLVLVECCVAIKRRQWTRGRSRLCDARPQQVRSEGQASLSGGGTLVTEQRCDETLENEVPLSRFCGSLPGTLGRVSRQWRHPKSVQEICLNPMVPGIRACRRP